MDQKKSQAKSYTDEAKIIEEGEPSASIKINSLIGTNEEKFSVMFQASPVAMSLATFPEGRMIDVNLAWLDLVGITGKETVVGKTSVELGLIPETGSRENILNEFKQKGSVKNAEITAITKNGTRINLLVNVKVVEIGGIRCLFSTNENITERKQAEKIMRAAEKELEQSEVRYRRIVETANEGIMTANIDGIITFVNKKLADMLGYKVDELIGKTGIELIPPDQIDFAKDRIKSRKSGDPDSYDIKFVHKNGEILWMHANGAPIYDTEGFHIGNLGMYTDITKSKQADEVLAFQARLLSEVSDAVFSSDCNYIINYWNQAAEKMFGWTREEVMGKNSGELLRPRVDGSSRTRERAKLRSDGHWEGEVEYIRKDGTYFFADVNSTILKDSNGKYTGNVIVIRDITERKKTQDALRESEEKYRTIVETANEGLWIVDSDGKTTYVNQRLADMLGYTIEEMMTNPWQLFLYETEIPISETRIGQLTGNLEIEESYELTLKRKDGNPLWVLVHASILTDNKGRHMGSVGMISDISDLKRKENELKQNELKLRELIDTKDKFFNIIAHDMKNPFTSLIGSSELLVENIDQLGTEKIKALAIIINDASKHGYGILLNLLDWSRSQTGMLKLNPEVINLRNLIDEQIKNLAHISNNKEIEVNSSAKNDIFITADKNIINTILRNLISNAVKYSHRKGVVIINATQNDKKCIISVKDNGIGISPEKLERIFKLENKLSAPGTENEQGTGLGLKLCKELVEKIEGEIWAESIENKGSEFKFSIPYNE